ncbi:bifunctional demethylmenaquinone methyltransferase/2-methoxy-6-polyprenyl-1,4-benzoquinol methylase UbiE [Rubrivivax gelatinosus]|uniref:Ubiquinone/menaquinone biosynthesis C-methyltransferase UbiE n=1 Tax=Rubrivivax gelatinosus TaxID=28068 RepID=A0A4R2MC49_RUBGE|nr:bifunctional demethylmenaquinone methyltransferase/2-methoxy-6-polyprenyl-1,4-benzoquinol methylase UbiE [Rubrivivax gelatinosus]MBK1686074.1 bifunctional demethylmenaquinone methyltransferase/2-methoxy-6-polyprenyl-1,4-benzoquinol methylase [Rubrivivax gelatinosus]TCP03901.1 2-octaprenyl-6-methoxy-1,4-benzoquinone methylase /demethylmenaquinone methyltransferase [Rubrivivax gelatinosus]
MNEPTPLSRSFGYQSVDEREREQRIRRVFSAVAARYDLMNDLMSLGIHRLWKRRFVRMAAPQAGQHIVDLAGGTGDVAALMAAADRRVTVVDPSAEMMAVGQARGHAHVEWLVGSAEQLPLADASVDTLTISFGIRNATRIDVALREIHRVLKPGGRFLCLEFSTPAWWLRPFYNLFSFTVIPRLGAWIANSPEAYTYLVESIRRFPDQPRFAAMIGEAGFEQVRWHDLSFGIASVHIGTRPAAAGPSGTA